MYNPSKKQPATTPVKNTAAALRLYEYVISANILCTVNIYQVPGRLHNGYQVEPYVGLVSRDIIS